MQAAIVLPRVDSVGLVSEKGLGYGRCGLLTQLAYGERPEGVDCGRSAIGFENGSSGSTAVEFTVECGWLGRVEREHSHQISGELSGCFEKAGTDGA